MKTIALTAALATALAVGVGVYIAQPPTSPRPSPRSPAPATASAREAAPAELEARLAEVEEQLAAFAVIEQRLAASEQRLAALEQRPVAAPASDLGGRLESLELRLGALERAGPSLSAEEALPGPVAAAGEEEPVLSEEALAALDERVDAALARQAEEQDRKRNKKPALDNFAELLELEPYQVLAVEQEVREGQRRVKELLETPTADGSNLYDELITAIAYGEVEHPEAPMRFMTWFGRLGETIPGREETYGQAIEGVKSDVRSAFQREFSEEQYAEYQAWGVDPIEIEEIPDSPWADIEYRVAEQAALLEAEQR